MIAVDPASSPLRQMTVETKTELWNDSCEVRSLERAIARGATGATSNPVIVLGAIEADPGRWTEITRGLIRDHRTASELELAWMLVAAATREGAALLMPTFDRRAGRGGRISIQTSPALYRDAAGIIEQATKFAMLAPNIAVKVPATAAGIVAIEELTARGVVINATVSFTVAQAIATAEAVERGLARLEGDVDRARITPWITIMAGRIDDHLRGVAKTRSAAIDPEHIRCASTAIVRRAYRLFRERGYRSTLLVAAMRSHHHWSEFVGGELVITIPPEWQDTFDASGVEVRSRIDDAVDPAILAELSEQLPDFVRAYDEHGLTIADFDSFAPTVATLRQFLGALDRLQCWVRDVMLPP